MVKAAGEAAWLSVAGHRSAGGRSGDPNALNDQPDSSRIGDGIPAPLSREWEEQAWSAIQPQPGIKEVKAMKVQTQIKAGPHYRGLK